METLLIEKIKKERDREEREDVMRGLKIEILICTSKIRGKEVVVNIEAAAKIARGKHCAASLGRIFQTPQSRG